jgi:hypothetical protein
MKRLGLRFRPWALLLTLALVAAAAGFATTRSPGEFLRKASGLLSQSAASPRRANQSGASTTGAGVGPQGAPVGRGGHGPMESRLVKAHSFDGDLRDLPYVEPVKMERPEREPPALHPSMIESAIAPEASVPSVPPRNAPAPAPIQNFDGMDYDTNGNGHPPDTNGDVGPNHYIETINTSIGIYSKTGTPITALTFNAFMSQGNFGNLCDTNNFGDPVVLYDTFEDRWIITDFAFTFDGSGNISNPPGAFQCFATSKTGDPVSGGWNFYSLNLTDGFGDYPKFGVWPDGLYMSANIFDFAASGGFQNVRVWALNKAQMYAGSPTVQVVSFNAPAEDFTILPANARLQAGTPPASTPNYYVSTSEFLNALTVYKFHVDWNSISLSTFTGPDTPIAATSWPNASVPNVPSLGGNPEGLDTLQIRAMMQNQYTNLGGVESLWASHTVRRGDTSGFAAPRFYQVNVTGGTVAASLPQAATFDPDGANVIHRWMPSLAVDRAGNMALGYSTSNSATKPAIKFAGRLSTDPINTFGETEQLLIQGLGTQVGTCGPSDCTRWGDYSAMTLDPDGCTFWYTNEYYAADGLNHHTRIGSFKYNECTPVGNGGTVTGTVTATVGGTPIGGATVTLGSRATTTNGSGVYSFVNIPAGTYPTMTASFPGYNTATASSIVVTDGGTTTRNFSLDLAPAAACLTDTTQANFLTGVGTNVDLATSPGNVILSTPTTIDQQNTSVTNTGFGFTSTAWFGQTFQPAVTGQMTRADIDLFCFNCTGTTPNITVSVRATTGDLPTGADLATATIAGFSSGSGGLFAANFGSPATLTAGTRYALVLRAVSNPSAGTYAYVVSTGSPYANGRRVTSGNSGATWTGATTDVGFKTYMVSGFAASGDLVSGLKDANPAAGSTPNWTILSWNATVPANTNLKFQMAPSNNALGPFGFVGPDGTAGTFFTTSGASLAQFTGFRYLKYRAFLSTADSTVTPTVNDVTVCFTNGPVLTPTPTPTNTPTNTPTRTPTNTPTNTPTRTPTRTPTNTPTNTPGGPTNTPTSTPATGFLHTLVPCRVLDTRNSNGPYGGPALSQGPARTFVIAGQCAVPPTAQSVVVNLTVTQPSAAGFLTVYAAGSAAPLASNINYRAGQTRANNAIVTLGPSGDIAVACGQPSGTVHFILDVSGYFQ